jgi:hypothetical protein
VSKAFDVTVDYPPVIIVGETYTVTATIINNTPDPLKVTITRAVAETNTALSNVFLDLGTVSGVQTKVQVVNTGSVDVTFSIKGQVAAAPGSPIATSGLTVLFTAVNNTVVNALTAATSYAPTVSINVPVLRPEPLRREVFSGILTTDHAGALTTDSVSFTFTTPSTAAALLTL